nr:hypothetical protein [Tanacetum cinerariifolium]
MDNPNITMEEYIRFEEENAHRHGKVAVSCEPTISSLYNNEIDCRISFDESEDEDYPRSETSADITDFEDRLGKIYYRGIHRVLVLDFKSLPAVMDEGLTSRMLMEHRDTQGHSVFTSRAWRQLFEIQGPLIFELIMEFFSTFRFSEVIIDIDDEESAGRISDKGDLSAYWRGIYFEGDFMSTPSSYTHIRDPMLRLCQRLIACSIVGRSQEPEKVIVTDLFYLRGMDVGSVNIPYLLARYLRMFDSGRKRRYLRMFDSGRKRRHLSIDLQQPKMMDHAGVRYTSYPDFHISYVRRTRCKTDDANTSALQQPDP